MAVSPTSRRTNIWLVGLLLSVPASKACATDALPACNPLPRIERFTEPTYPPIVERGGMHDPVSVILLFTITSRGAVIAVRVVQIDTEFHADEFAAQAREAIATIQFERISAPCRGRMRVVFKIANP